MVPAAVNMRPSNPYLARFEEQFEQEGASRLPAWLYPLRKTGITHFSELGFPTVQEEDWRFTNVAPIAKLQPVFAPSSERLNLRHISELHFSGIKNNRLVFVNGVYSKELSSILPQPEGVRIMSLAEAIAAEPTLVQKHLGRYARVDDSGFSALNTAFFGDGAFIFVPAAQSVNEAVHLLFISTAREPGATVHPRNLIVTERDTKLTVIENYASTGESSYFTNALNEIVIGENAVVEHCKFQEEARSAFHIGSHFMTLGKASNFVSHSFAFGAKLSRNNIRTRLNGEGLDCILNGLYLTR